MDRLYNRRTRVYIAPLFMGTGKFSSNRLMLEAILASGSQMITVAMKRIDMDNADTDDMPHTSTATMFQFLP